MRWSPLLPRGAAIRLRPQKAGRLAHVGVNTAPNKSTLSYANQHRPASLFEAVFYRVLDRFRSGGLLGHRAKPFGFKNKLLSLDATVITLCLALFPWARFRRKKGGVKLIFYSEMPFSWPRSS